MAHQHSVLPADNAAVTTHLTLIQGIINRLANNSASCKTWCITLIAALVGLAGAIHVPGVITFGLVPVIVFGIVDSLYLAQEKAYRNLYTSMVALVPVGRYSTADVYKLRAPIELKEFFLALFSWSVLPVYWLLIAFYLLAAWRGWLDVIAGAR